MRAGDALMRVAAASVQVIAFARIGFAVAGKADAVVPSKYRYWVMRPGLGRRMC